MSSDRGWEADRSGAGCWTEGAVERGGGTGGWRGQPRRGVRWRARKGSGASSCRQALSGRAGRCESDDNVQRAKTALLSEAALAEDWNRPEEDEAWKHLQEVP